MGLIDWLRRRLSQRWCPICARHRDVVTMVTVDPKQGQPVRAGEELPFDVELLCAQCGCPLEAS